MPDALPPGSNTRLTSDGELSRFARLCGLETFGEAVEYVQRLPYGRTSEPDFRLVLTEGRGTCSSKHAFLAALARENGLVIELVLGVYEMTEENTPGVGNELAQNGLSAIPEAHCFLRTDHGVFDVTMPEGSRKSDRRHFLHEEVITPEDVGIYKAIVHRRVLAG
ncbi:hypothetical protein EGT36_23515 [Agrobacterium sp. FDAARGOS_525]|uniref:hypothetical protein n=1 Tax=Agrobacterium sp. FDAARGOS_525 TaxID=2420311 RepID=UPI000F659F74|nr:hypothetical protein [Agrobacterium sp. FDAARGOS_525]RSC31580.1 hypothetical protein EGT36_23515 [Agrobacterium sp. FDAARGOS_525]